MLYQATSILDLSGDEELVLERHATFGKMPERMLTRCCSFDLQRVGLQWPSNGGDRPAAHQAGRGIVLSST